ncbi:MAG TPA: DNA polymerase III subunit gamma/tau [Candidatus Saccharimonadales bacterium]
MGQALYRKHRPKKLKDVVGQEHVTDTLEQALKQGRISHAYLFTGPRGVGKTSIARIWAHEINGLPYDDDSAHMDIIEIDAASNRRIDEIRELRDKVYVAPTSAKYKVYIIDEVHMLTREAFNALLKTLEEPPAHVVFILATTDAHKLPETIISRTQRFSFRPVDKAKVVAHLKDMAKKEKIDVSDEALELLAEHGEGSFRDSISLLDQASSHSKKLDAHAVQQLLGLPSGEAITALLEAVTTGAEAATIMSSLTQLYDQGFQAAAIAKQLAVRVRQQLIDNSAALSSDQALALLSQLLEVPAAHNPERFLEIVLLQASPNKKAAPKAEPVKIAEEPPKPAPKTEKKPQPEAPKAAPEPPKAAVDFDESAWQNILQALKKKHNTLYGVVRMAQPTFLEDDGLQLAFAFAFHQKRINEAGNRKKLVDTIAEVTGKNISIECTVDKNAKASAPTGVAVSSEAPPQDISTISNIFGGGELLES